MEFFERHLIHRRACLVANANGRLHEYFTGDLATIEELAKSWHLFTAFYELEEKQPPASAMQLLSLLNH